MTDRARIPKLLILTGAGDTRDVLAALPAAMRANAVLLQGRGATFPADLCARQISHVLDISHGFDGDISHIAAQACAAQDVAYIAYQRPAWTAEPQDTWIDAPNMAAAVAALAPHSRVFATTGRGSLDAFDGFEGHVFLRQTSGHGQTAPAPNCTYIFGTPPFSTAQEIALFQELEIDCVLFRNNGGQAARSKLEAARALGLPMVMLARPALPTLPTRKILPDIQSVREWSESL